MTALPQIFATQPAPARPSGRESASLETTAPVQPRDSDSRENHSNPQTTERRFDDAMSEQAPFDKSAPKAPRDSSDAAAPSTEAKRKEPAQHEAGSDDVSELAFSDFVAASNTSAPSQTDETEEAEAPAPAPAPDKKTTPLPAATSEAALDPVEAPQVPPLDVQSEQGEAARATETKPVDIKEANARAELGETAKTPNPSDPQVTASADPVASKAEPTASNPEAVVSAESPSAKETGALKAQNEGQIQADADLQTQKQPQAPQLTVADARQDGPTEDLPRMTRADLDTIRSDRAAFVTAPGPDGLPDMDRPGPMGAKPFNLSALGDTVSVPGLNNALAASQMPASSPVPSTLAGPLAGLSERLAASLMQTAQMNPTVTLDKLPQTVIAVALSHRSATIQIDPPELGRIQLDYQFDTQGRTTVTLTPESDAARAALVDRMATITAALEQGSSSGVDVKLGNAQDFGTAFSEASDGETGGGESAGSAETASELSDDPDSVQPQMGHHIAADGTARLHMRV